MTDYVISVTVVFVLLLIVVSGILAAILNATDKK